MGIEVLPDGSRLYKINVPVKAEYAERKVGYEIAIVRCKDVEDYDWMSGDNKKIKKVEAHMTYVNGSIRSFSSCSGDKFDNDELACWASVCSLYHRW